MANRRIGGFKWRFNRLTPTATEPPIDILPVASGYSTALYDGDPVKKLSDGTIAAAAPGDTMYGVFAGAERYYDGSVIRRGGSLPASTTYGSLLERQSLARVIPFAGQIFELDANDGTTATTQSAHQALIGENCEWATGTNVNDQSGAVLNISTHATTNTLSLRLYNLATYPDQDFASAGVKYLVYCNLVQDGGPGTTTGV